MKSRQPLIYPFGEQRQMGATQNSDLSSEAIWEAFLAPPTRMPFSVVSDSEPPPSEYSSRLFAPSILTLDSDDDIYAAYPASPTLSDLAMSQMESNNKKATEVMPQQESHSETTETKLEMTRFFKDTEYSQKRNEAYEVPEVTLSTQKLRIIRATGGDRETLDPRWYLNFALWKSTKTVRVR